jgi:hypothetical protein
MGFGFQSATLHSALFPVKYTYNAPTCSRRLEHSAWEPYDRIDLIFLSFRARTVHLRTRLTPFGLTLNEEQIPQVVVNNRNQDARWKRWKDFVCAQGRRVHRADLSSAAFYIPEPEIRVLGKLFSGNNSGNFQIDFDAFSWIVVGCRAVSSSVPRRR